MNDWKKLEKDIDELDSLQEFPVEKTLKFNFSISGEWLTKFIRDGVISEGKGYPWAVETMVDLMKPNGLDRSTVVKMTQDIIIGRGCFSGNTGDGSFSYNDEDNGTPDEFFEYFDRIFEDKKALRRAYTAMNDAWSELADLITGVIERDDLKCGPNIQFKIDEQLQEYIERKTDVEAEKREPYGFITPEGEFHPVEWCEHESFALRYIDEHGLRDSWENNEDYHHLATDYLVYVKGWLLLNNPGQGKPKLTSGYKPMTKAQREALFDYYIKAGREVEANTLYAESMTND